LTFRIGFLLQAGAWAGLLGLLGWAAAWKLATTGPARAPIAHRALAGRRQARAAHPAAHGPHPGERAVFAAAERSPDLAELCAGMDGEGAGDALEECYCDPVASWMAANSHAAGKIIRELDVPPPIRLRLEAQLLAERDFASAYEWADRLPNSDDRISALSSVLYEGALEAPGEVLEFARDADLGDKKGLVLGTILRRWSRTDSAAAGRWLGSQTAEGRVW
jgi:hypothetical protein